MKGREKERERRERELEKKARQQADQCEYFNIKRIQNLYLKFVICLLSASLICRVHVTSRHILNEATCCVFSQWWPWRSRRQISVEN